MFNLRTILHTILLKIASKLKLSNFDNVNSLEKMMLCFGVLILFSIMRLD